MISREVFNESEFLTISKVQKLTQVAGSRVELGRCRVLALATTPSQLKSDQQLFCKSLLQKSSSIKKKNHLQQAEQSLPTESCQFSCDKRPVYSLVAPGTAPATSMQTHLHLKNQHLANLNVDPQLSCPSNQIRLFLEVFCYHGLPGEC